MSTIRQFQSIPKQLGPGFRRDDEVPPLAVRIDLTSIPCTADVDMCRAQDGGSEAADPPYKTHINRQSDKTGSATAAALNIGSVEISFPTASCIQ